MESNSYKIYIEKIIADNFSLDIFSPENSGNLFEVFKKNFYRNSPYWKEYQTESDSFYIEFKKYGENRKIIFLKFAFLSQSKKPRDIELMLTNQDFKKIRSIILSLSDIWQDNSVLVETLKKIIKEELDLAAKTN